MAKRLKVTKVGSARSVKVGYIEESYYFSFLLVATKVEQAEERVSMLVGTAEAGDAVIRGGICML